MKSTFVGLSSDEVAALRNQEPIVGAICGLRREGKPISFKWLRELAGRDRDLRSDLGYGRNILSSTEEFDQYLYSYGLMIACQWEALTETVAPMKGPIRLVDYGCGQGLAGLLLFDKFGDAFSSALSQVVLIEPSAVGLIRAEAVYRCIAPECEIVCVKKRFDDLGSADLMTDNKLDTLHIFSNVMDIDGWDHFRLFVEMMTEGRHSMLVVSASREFDGGSPRIRNLKAAVDNPEHHKELSITSITKSELCEYDCGPGGKYSAISWQLELEVSGG